VADELPNITVEILKQIRDGVSHLGDRMDAVRTELGGRIDNLGVRIDAVRTELKGELVELRGVVAQHGRIVDHALQVSLEDSGRLEVIEGGCARSKKR